ncbi:MAG: plastocyanin [Patescibacteria group bacterium]|jgi:plastocyanin
MLFMKSFMLYIIIGVIVLGGLFYVFNDSDKGKDNDETDKIPFGDDALIPTDEEIDENTVPVEDDSDDSVSTGSVITGNVISDGGSSDVKTFVVWGKSFEYSVNGVSNGDIVVDSGDLVRIEFTSTSGYHDWVVDEFDAATEKVSDGESSFVEFVALGSGSFEYYCSVGSHRAAGMEGKFIVR